MKHLAENTIQAFLDGELSGELLTEATAHLAECDFCADALVAAEAEIAEINSAFAAENAVPCPTQRIWARIENEIEVCAWQSKAAKAEEKTVWARFAEFFTPAQVAFAGGLAAVVLISLVSLSFFEQQLNQSPNEIALERPIVNNQNPSAVSIPTDSDSISARPIQNELIAVAPPPDNAPRTISASYTRPVIQKPQTADRRLQIVASSSAPLAEEKDYLNSIAQLSQVVKSGDETLMRPSFRVEYERNLAMVDQAIRAMQKQARRNPADENAKRILFASYQNKIELLSAVSEKSQLVASMQ